MADTRNPGGAQDPIRPARSMLRDGRSGAARDQRPAGPSGSSNPGMGEPATPLLPGVKSGDPHAWTANPKVAGNFRFDSADEADKNAWAQRRDISSER